MDEEAHDGADVALVHREALAPVVERGAERRNWLMIVPPYSRSHSQHVRVERLAAELALGSSPPARASFSIAALRRDAGVVVAGLEERVEAAHPVPADERVLERELQAWPMVQRRR